jgi:hypothetical protein
MRNKLLFAFFFLLIATVFYTPVSYSANPTYSITLANEVQTAANVYEFDIYLLRTGADALELGGLQIGLTYNAAALNGGTLAATWVSGSTDAAIVAAQGNPKSIGVAGGIIRGAATVPSGGAGTGAIISNTPPGMRYGRMRLTNSVNFSSQALSIAWTFITYPTKLSAYLPAGGGGTNTEITDPAEFLNTLANGTLPVELNSFTSTVSEREVNLNWITKTEINSSRFEINRALVNSKETTVTWASVGVVQATGSSNSPNKYTFTEKDLQAGKYQYRLKIIDNNGSFKYSSVIETEVALPKNFEVSQNYPNPFNPTTRINYSLPFNSNVSLEIFNIAGERIGQIVNEEQSAGYYSVNFNSSTLYRSLASGVYIYRVIAVNKSTGNVFSSIKKMMLLK